MKKMHDPVIDETIYFDVLENGLPVYIMPKVGFKQKYAAFATNYGSIDNRFRVAGEKNIVTVPNGIAHFLEHKMFEDEDVNVFDKFAYYGANVNAYTTYTTTSYFFDTCDNFAECLELLLDFVQYLYLTDETVEKEKGIIAQEILMYEDDPDWMAYLNLLKALFHVHPVREDIAGTIESISQINRELILKCYNIFYHPSNMILFVVGDLDPEWVFELVYENQIKKDYTIQPFIERFYPNEPKTIFKKRVESSMPVSRPIYKLGFKEQKTGEDGNLLLKKELATNMLLEILVGKGSELYQKLYASGLIDDSFSISYSGERDHGMTVLGGQTSDPERLHAALIEGIQAKMGQIKEEELERVRKRLIGDYITIFDSLSSIVQNFIAYHFRNMNLFHELKILNEITLDYLEERFEEHFNLANHAVSIIYPL
ncbi:zinc protease [Anoxybacter fermentans]|uniref:Zinc protease n=1 Tax=Anoxybacter fermentans TaxID=1323375 RepID=A0A3S9T2S0_9FIRM|nr:zinc protease [Anoxybacter fermentans]